MAILANRPRPHRSFGLASAFLRYRVLHLEHSEAISARAVKTGGLTRKSIHPTMTCCAPSACMAWLRASNIPTAQAEARALDHGEGSPSFSRRKRPYAARSGSRLMPELRDCVMTHRSKYRRSRRCSLPGRTIVSAGRSYLTAIRPWSHVSGDRSETSDSAGDWPNRMVITRSLVRR